MVSKLTFEIHNDPWWSYFLRPSEPYKEVTRHFNACFSEEEISLCGRVVHFFKGAFYLLPVINTIILIAKDRFSTPTNIEPSESSSSSDSSKSSSSLSAKKISAHSKQPPPPPPARPKRPELTEEQRKKLEQDKKERAEKAAQLKKEQAKQAKLKKVVDDAIKHAKEKASSEPDKALEKIASARARLLKKQEEKTKAATGEGMEALIEKETKASHEEKAKPILVLESTAEPEKKPSAEKIASAEKETKSSAEAKAPPEKKTAVAKKAAIEKETKTAEFIRRQIDRLETTAVELYTGSIRRAIRDLSHEEALKKIQSELEPLVNHPSSLPSWDKTKITGLRNLAFEHYPDAKTFLSASKTLKNDLSKEKFPADRSAAFERKIYFLERCHHLRNDLIAVLGILPAESYLTDEVQNALTEVEDSATKLSDYQTILDEIIELNKALENEEADCSDQKKVEYLKSGDILSRYLSSQLHFVGEKDEAQGAIQYLFIKLKPFTEQIHDKIDEADALIQRIEENPGKEHRADYLNDINRLRNLFKAALRLIPDEGESKVLRKDTAEAIKRLEKAAVYNDLIKKEWASHKKHYNRKKDGTISRQGSQRRTLKSMKFEGIHTTSPTVHFSHKKGLNQNVPGNNLCGYYALFFLYQSAMQAMKVEIIDGEEKTSSEIDYCNRGDFNAFFKEARKFIWKTRTLSEIVKLDEIPATFKPLLMGLGLEEIKSLVQNIEFLAPLREMNNLYGLHLAGFRELKMLKENDCSVPLTRFFETDESIKDGQETTSLEFPMHVVTLIGAHYYFFRVEEKEANQWKISYTHSMEGNLGESTCKELIHCLFMGKRLGQDAFNLNPWYNRRNPPRK